MGKRERLYVLIVVLLILIALVVIYQIARLVIGGSWSVEDVILALLVFHLGVSFTLGLMVAELRSDHSHLAHRVNALANDFKQYKTR